MSAIRELIRWTREEYQVPVKVIDDAEAELAKLEAELKELRELKARESRRQARCGACGSALVGYKSLTDSPQCLDCDSYDIEFPQP